MQHGFYASARKCTAGDGINCMIVTSRRTGALKYSNAGELSVLKNGFAIELMFEYGG